MDSLTFGKDEFDQAFDGPDNEREEAEEVAAAVAVESPVTAAEQAPAKRRSSFLSAAGMALLEQEVLAYRAATPACGRSAAEAEATPATATGKQRPTPAPQGAGWEPPTPTYYRTLRLEVEALLAEGRKVLPIICQALPEPLNAKGKPKFGGKNPSCWLPDEDRPPAPMMIDHGRITPSAEVWERWIRTARKYKLPLGVAIAPTRKRPAIDFDAKDYAGGAEELWADVDRLLAEHPGLATGRIERTPSGGCHLYVKVKDELASWSKGPGKGLRCNFTTTEGGAHRGEVLAGTRVCVTWPTPGYELVDRERARGRAEIADLAAIGIWPSAGRRPAKTDRRPVAGRRPQAPPAGGPVPELRELLGKYAQGVLVGERPYGEDRSSNFAGFLRELYSVTNWLEDDGLPVSGDADDLIADAIHLLDIEDKADRVGDTIDPASCELGPDAVEKRRKRYNYQLRQLGGGQAAEAVEALRAGVPTVEDIRGRIEELRREMSAAQPRPRWSASGWVEKVNGIAEAIGAHVVARKAEADRAPLMDDLQAAAGGERKGPQKQHLKERVAAGAAAQREAEEAACAACGGSGAGVATGGAAGGGAPFRVLGWDTERKMINYQHCTKGHLGSLSGSGSGSAGLFALAPLEWWQETYQRPPARGERRNGPPDADWELARSALAEMADQRGIFDAGDMRGRGVWIDEGRVVWHQGERLEVDGVDTSIIDFTETRFVYPMLRPLEVNPGAPPLTPEQGRQILEAVKAVGWKGADTHLLLAGWAVVSNVAGALKNRPAVQVTGQFSKGKTTAVEQALLPLLPGVGNRARPDVTAAGLRQERRSDALAAAIDESEQGDKKGSTRAQMLELARYSFDGSSGLRGTVHGRALNHSIRFPVLLIGINATISDPATRSRFVVATKQHLPQVEWDRASELVREAITPAVGDSLLRLTVSGLPVLLENVETFVRAVEQAHTGSDPNRVPDCCGPLLAGAHFLVHPERVSEQEAAQWLAEKGWGTHEDPDGNTESPEAEGVELLDQLLSHRPPRATDNMRALQLWEMLKIVRESPAKKEPAVREDLEVGPDRTKEAEAELARFGLAALGVGNRQGTEDSGLFVANDGPALLELFAGGRWANKGHTAHLAALPGAYSLPKHRKIWLAGKTRRGVVIPWESVEG